MTDADLSDTVTMTVKECETVGGDNTNGLDEAAVLPFFGISTPGPLNADPGDAKNISGRSIRSEAFKFLQKDEELVLTCTVDAVDSFGAGTLDDVNITITGTRRRGSDRR